MRSARSTDSNRRPRRYDPTETRTRVLEAAYLLFGTRGYERSSTADIAREAGVSEGSIFYHFGSKPALLEELGRLHGTRLIAAIEAGQRPQDVSIATAINRCFDFCETGSLWDRVAPGGAPGEAEASPESRPFFEAARGMLVEWAKTHIRAHRAAGVDMDVDIAGSLMFAVINDAVRQYLAAGATAAQRARIRHECTRFCAAAIGQQSH